MEATSEVSSQALGELQSDLRLLSTRLQELYETLNADMSDVEEFWKDPKYQEFVNGYKPQINKCEEISQRYNTWQSTVLQEAKDKATNIEMLNVGGSGLGASMSAGSAAGTATGSAIGNDAGISAPSSSGTKSRLSGWNLSGKGVSSSNPNPVLTAEQQVSDAAADMCARNPNAVGNIKVEQINEGDSWGVNGKGQVGVHGLFGGIVEGGIEGGGEYNSGKTTSKITVEQAIDCSKL